MSLPRILASTFLLLCMAAPAVFAENYRGEMNGWGTTGMSNTTWGSRWEVTIVSGADDATSEFKFDQDGDWDPNWGSGSNGTKNATAGDLDSGGGNPSSSVWASAQENQA